MDLAMTLTAAGLVVAVVATVFSWLQLRRTPPPALNPPADDRGAPPALAGAGLTAIGALPPPTGRLPDRVHGRGDLLAELHALVETPDGRVHLVAGLGGTGKTTVALKLAADVRDRGRPVWWVPAAEAGSLTTQLLGLARELGATAGEVEEALAGRRNPADLLWRFLDAARGWLLVIDNADDPGVLRVGDQPVDGGNGWLRPTSSGLILVTSRVGDAAQWGRHVSIHPLSALSAAEGARVLLDLAPGAGTQAEAEALSARLGGLALALRHAGKHLGAAFSAERHFTAYREALESKGPRMMSESADARSNITTTWELSLDLLAGQGLPQARALLGVLSCFAASAPIPAFLLDHELLGGVCGERGGDGVSAGLTALHSVGLIESDTTDMAAGPPGVVVHPLVAETTRRLLAGDDLGRRTAGVAAALVARAVGALHADRAADWPEWRRLYPHAYRLWRSVPGELGTPGLTSLAEASSACAAALTWSGSYRSAADLTELALKAATDRLPADDPAVLELRHRHASAYMFLGRAADAEGEFRGILQDRERVLGPEHPKTLTIRHNLARVIADQDRLADAEEEMRQTYEARLRTLGPDHPDTLATRHEAARVFMAQGRTAEAELEFRSIHEAKVRVLGPEHPDTLVTRHEIPRALVALGRAPEAEHELRELYDLRLRLLGPDHPHVMTTGHALAQAFAAQGRHDEAERQYRLVLDARRRVLGPDNTYTRRTEEALSALTGGEPGGEPGESAPAPR
ncbi:tetratricopeptide repeat protein [Actinomadura scrupuli]|uniref:tetratricopeptide repeat protein n=1 Tax=Actinomadura scrupuli TaxID=559629 RepID=UPI003D9532CB